MGTLLGFVLCFRCFFTVTGPFVSVLIRSVEAVSAWSSGDRVDTGLRIGTAKRMSCSWFARSMIIVGDRTFVGEVDWRGFGLWFRAEAMSLYDNALEIINTAIPTQVS